ncbi:hypothetical protein AAAT87_04355 [Segatella sinensis]|uniref:Uncharacterized protein n=1 Tax=Segatella sinensis TaxID=3085167 RepID=A0ABV1FWJ9_9BACT
MKFKVFAIYAMRFTVCVALAFYCVGVYAQRKEVSYFNDSVDICPLADKELIDSCYNLLDRNMMLETDGIYGQIAVIDATTSEVLAWASLEKQLDDECEGCGDMIYVPFKKNIWAISDTTKTNNAIELALSFKQRGVKQAGRYNILQYDYNKRCFDEFTFVGCFPADNPKYSIGMVVIRPHKLPATAGMLSKEVNLLIEWLMTRKK